MELDGELMAVFAFFSFWLGACVASFLNVVAWRLPRGESIVSPPSHCPKCNAPIKWWQNIPILSWLALRGRCANCSKSISPRYIRVELLGGCLFLAAFFRYCPFVALSQSNGVFLDYVKVVVLIAVWIWISLMIVGSLVDFDHQLLPDFTTIGGMVLGVIVNLAVTIVNWILLPHIANDGQSVVVGVEGLIRYISYPIFWSLSGLAFGFGGVVGEELFGVFGDGGDAAVHPEAGGAVAEGGGDLRFKKRAEDLAGAAPGGPEVDERDAGRNCLVESLFG